jgi:peptidyl-prolyl cis-trans isomerase A (cyclophilin A)
MSNPQIALSTSLGDIIVVLDIARAPRTAGHFLSLVQEGAMADASFYRVTHPDPAKTPPLTIDVVQGGVGWARCLELATVAHEPTSETGLRHVDGAVSLARSAERDGSSEFFICVGDQPILDAGATPGPGAAGFAVFGRVTAGMEVVRRIHRLPADAPPPGGDMRFHGQFLTEPLPISFSAPES